jgi:hypothetical protein
MLTNLTRDEYCNLLEIIGKIKSWPTFTVSDDGEKGFTITMVGDGSLQGTTMLNSGASECDGNQHCKDVR